MKSLITYFSFTGHSEKVAKIFANILQEKGQADIQRLIPQTEIKNFFLQGHAAIRKMRAVLGENIKFNVSDYDLIVLGSPIWAFHSTPAINAYLDQVTGLKGKKVILFLTTGGKIGVCKCFEKIEKILREKGAVNVMRIGITDKQWKNEAAIQDDIKKIIENMSE